MITYLENPRKSTEKYINNRKLSMGAGYKINLWKSDIYRYICIHITVYMCVYIHI